MTVSPRPPVSASATVAVGIEAFAALVEGRHRQIGAEPHGAGVGRERAGEKIDERGLAAAVGADDADAVAALDAGGEIATTTGLS